MFLADLFRAAFWGLRSRPSRTGALITSLAAGVTAAVFVGVIISGFSREIDRLAFGAYSHALVIRENSLVVDRHGPPTLDDRDHLMRELGQVVSSAAWKSGNLPIYRSGQALEFRVYGVIGDYVHELDSAVVAGRFLTLEETAGVGRTCLVGAEVALALGDSPSLVGRAIRVGGANCVVVGVLGEPRSRPAARFAEAVIAPLAAAERYMIADTDLGPSEVDTITIFMQSDVDLPRAQMRADILLRNRLGAPQSRPSPFAYGDRNVSLEQMLEQRRVISRLLGTLAGLSILTSLIAFGSLSAATVLSRQREIAVRIAIGASDQMVQAQLLLESGIVGATGGAVGVVVGITLGKVASLLWSWPFAPDFRVAATAFVLGALVGLSAGLWAAVRATSLPPSLAARG